MGVTIGFMLLGVGSASPIAMTLKAGSRTQRPFDNAVLRFFGKYSYGLYIFHFSVGSFLSDPVSRWFSARTHNNGLSIIATDCVVLTVAIVISLLSYHLYEKHFLKLKKYFSYDKRNTRIEKVPGEASL